MSCRCCDSSVRTNLLGGHPKMRGPGSNVANIRNHSAAVENTVGELQVTVNGNYNLTPANFVRNELVVLEAGGESNEDDISSKITESTDLSTGHLLVHSTTQTKKYSNNINL